MNLKRTLLVVTVPAVLAAGGVGMLMAHAATPTPTPKAGQTAAPTEGQNETGGAAEAPDAPEAPGAPDAGHADNPNDPNADHQFNGEE